MIKIEACNNCYFEFKTTILYSIHTLILHVVALGKKVDAQRYNIQIITSFHGWYTWCSKSDKYHVTF